MPNNYHFFGCSWTGWGGCNYVQSLAEAVPNHNFYNWGCSGSSISLSTFLLDCIKQRYNTNENVFVFQATMPARVTWWSDSFNNTLDQGLAQIYKNYFKLANMRPKYWDSFSPSFCERQNKKYSRMYYSYSSNAVIQHEYKTHLQQATEKSDYIFLQKHPGIEIENNIKVIENVLPSKEYKKYTKQGDGHHFGKEGAEWLADWMIKELKIAV